MESFGPGAVKMALYKKLPPDRKTKEKMYNITQNAGKTPGTAKLVVVPGTGQARDGGSPDGKEVVVVAAKYSPKGKGQPGKQNADLVMIHSSLNPLQTPLDGEASRGASASNPAEELGSHTPSSLHIKAKHNPSPPLRHLQ